MKLLISAEKIRSLVSCCTSDMDVIAILRSHKIRYQYTTETGSLSIRIPCRKGTIRIIRTCSRSMPFQVRNNPAVIAPIARPEYCDY